MAGASTDKPLQKLKPVADFSEIRIEDQLVHGEKGVGLTMAWKERLEEFRPIPPKEVAHVSSGLGNRNDRVLLA